MNTTFHPYRAPVWSGLKRYFVEWRKPALVRRELRMLSDGQSWRVSFRPRHLLMISDGRPVLLAHQLVTARPLGRCGDR